jgi:hypothetical protein
VSFGVRKYEVRYLKVDVYLQQESDKRTAGCKDFVCVAPDLRSHLCTMRVGPPSKEDNARRRIRQGRPPEADASNDIVNIVTS